MKSNVKHFVASKLWKVLIIMSLSGKIPDLGYDRVQQILIFNLIYNFKLWLKMFNEFLNIKWFELDFDGWKIDWEKIERKQKE